MAEEDNKAENTTPPAEETTTTEPETTPITEDGLPDVGRGASVMDFLKVLMSRLDDGGGDSETIQAIRALQQMANNLPGARVTNPLLGPFMASFVRPAGREKTGIAKASPERQAQTRKDREEKREANRSKQARSIVALSLSKGEGVNAAVGKLKDRFGDSYAESWASSNGFNKDSNGQYRATEDVQDGIVRAAGRMTPEDRASRRETRLAASQASRLKRMDKDGDGKISPAEEAADRTARDQRMRDRIINLEQTDVNTGERFRPDANKDGVIDEAERAEQNRRIGNVEPTYTSPRDQRRNAAFEGVGLRAPRAGETSAQDVITADSQEELDQKITQINRDFAGREQAARDVRARADAFEAQAPGVMEPSRVPGQALDIEAAMSQKIEEIMPSILDGSMTSEEGARQLVQLREGVIEQTDPTSADLQRLQQDSMNFGPTPMSTDEMQRSRKQAFPVPPADPMKMDPEMGGTSMLPPQAGEPIDFSEQELRGLSGVDAEAKQSELELQNRIDQFGNPRKDFPGDDNLMLDAEQKLSNPFRQQNSFLRDFFQPATRPQPDMMFGPGDAMRMTPQVLQGGQTIQYYDAMGTPIYG